MVPNVPSFNYVCHCPVETWNGAQKLTPSIHFRLFFYSIYNYSSLPIHFPILLDWKTWSYIIIKMSFEAGFAVYWGRKYHQGMVLMVHFTFSQDERRWRPKVWKADHPLSSHGAQWGRTVLEIGRLWAVAADLRQLLVVKSSRASGAVDSYS